ncbi:hypothetical protein A7X12_01500 [Sphingomonas sp. TDK1]|nr:hypothetical protein A7X12_01500 [Sphingomonas sp. TDK1]
MGYSFEILRAGNRGDQAVRRPRQPTWHRIDAARRPGSQVPLRLRTNDAAMTGVAPAMTILSIRPCAARMNW